jgi:small subunit ribosomal protein S2
MLAYRPSVRAALFGLDLPRYQVECVSREHQAAPKGSVLNNRRPARRTRRQGRNAAMAVVTTRQLLESGVHFGHQTRRWNPKMKRFIFTERNGIYIIDLQQSLTYIDRAYAFVKDTVARGGQVLFVGTKKQAQEAIAEQATRVGMPYVNQRWLGGMLTNFHTVIKRIQRLKELEGLDLDDVAASGLTKKELLGLRREKEKLERTLGGIRDMTRTPQAVWIVDTKKEHLAVDEARKLRIPVIAILDTNCDPDEVDFAIPGNDDAIRSVSLLTRVLADAVADGLMARSGAQTGTEAELEPMPDWELELLGATQEPAPATPHDAPAPDALQVPGEEQPEEAAIEAEEAADKELDLELQSDNPDPENVYDPDKGSTHS